MSAVLEVCELTVRRGGTRVLGPLSWSVQPGQMWSIIGPNGSGKTSLLSCLTGLLNATAGSIRVLGETYGESDWIGLRRRIGIVSSSLRQFIDDDEPALNVLGSGISGQINYWGRLNSAEAAAARAIARRMQCSAVLDRPWAVLSQGERQRVLIGRALISQPALLILDEPCAGLDPVARQRFLVFLQRLIAAPRSPSVVLVTHHLEEIPSACTHVLALRGGRPVGCGPMREVLTAPLLSQAFGAPVTLSCSRGEWRMQANSDT